jgi:asparagine synthase (glutamine-hydrolysing)
MRPRYLVIYGAQDPALYSRAARIAKAAAEAFGLSPAMSGGCLTVVTDPGMDQLPVGGDRGCVLGTLFDRNGPARALERLSFDAARDIIASHGECLVDGHWGSYVAALEDGARSDVAHLVRDPSGQLPCYHCAAEGLHLLFSDLEIPLALGLVDGDIHWPHLAHELAYGGLHTAETCIAGVQELLAGQRLTLSPAGLTLSCIWSPWGFVHADRQLDNWGDAVAQVHDQTLHCVEAWASRSRSVLVELSGGLDSSIVAACLKKAQADIACVTLSTPQPGADERRYARSVATQIGARLVETELSPDEAEVRAGPMERLPRPGINILQRLTDRAILRAAEAVGTDSFFGGGGGDGVFCYLGTAAPATDALRRYGMDETFFRAVGDVAELYQCTSWKAGRFAIRKMLRAAPRAWRQDRRFLSDGGVPQRPQDHPWLPPPSFALPGKCEQILGLVGLHTGLEGNARSSRGPIRHPLLSQPLLELCLRIPSWLWVSGGVNRAVARAAFAGDLPPEILNRRTKGDFMGFNASIFERSRGILRDLLLGGELAKHGILDPVAVETFLASPLLPRDNTFFRLFLIADAELWARSF